jgi:hypothetical protein
MINRQLSKKLVLTTGFLVAFGALSASRSVAAQGRSRASVSKGSQSQGSSGRTAVSRSSGSHSRGAASTRSGGGDRRSGSGRHHDNHGYRGNRHGSHYSYGFGLGYYGYGAFWGGYGGYYYNPFYYGYPAYYSYRPLRYRDFGALDLNIRPKKTEVWVDGQYVGTAGRFDGYPGHLWLGDGRHELILFNQGFETVRREVKVLEGLVLDINQVMVPGESVPAEELTAFSEEEIGGVPEPRSYREQIDEPQRRERRADRVDTREEPGRLKLEVAPMDASIYLDGRFLGSGHELERLHSGLIVSPGEHTLEVVRPGYDSEEIPFLVEPGEDTALQVELDEA